MRIKNHLIISSVLPLGLWASPALGLVGDGGRSSKDCGITSLYVLLSLCSRQVDLSELRERLPDPGGRGLSMAEIQAASRSFGASLRGTRVTRNDLPIDRPMIVLFRSGGKGHFLVLQPVGSRGKMVMVLDFPRPCRIAGYSELMESAGWTGLALRPVSRWERPWIYLAAAAGGGLTALGLAVPLWRRGWVLKNGSDGVHDRFSDP